MQHQYWVTKQCVLRKLGSKDDECIISSDAELDAKLELFRSVSESCIQLQRIIDIYQERLCLLAQEENALGRYLKECGKAERNRHVGQSMANTGKAIAYVGHQRLALRPSLVRLHHEVETFRGRGVSDTRGTISAMEKARTEYRAALSWMKSASQQLDPDSGHGLDSFRKAQTHVRSSKQTFDRMKLTCLQKVDLLAAARCNMFSHALVLYQSAIVTFATKANNALLESTQRLKTPATVSEPEIPKAADDVESTKELEETEPSKAEQDDNLFFNADYTDEDSRPMATAGEFMPSQLLLSSHMPLLQQSETTEEQKPQNKPSAEKTAWFELFAELDPLSNPDSLSGSDKSHAPA